MYADIIAAGLVGAAGGAVGGLLGALLDKAFTRGKPASGKRLGTGAIVGVVVGIAAVNGAGLRERVARMIAPQSTMAAFGQEVLAIPGVRERVRGKKPAEVQAITRQLAASGMLKLDDSFLVMRARLVAEMLTKADEPTCGRFAAGTLTGEEFVRLRDSLTEEGRAGFDKMTLAAVKAEVGAIPAAKQQAPSAEQIGAALAEVQKQLPQKDQARFAGNLGNLGRLDPKEACWTVRQLYSLVSKSSGQTQATLARAMMMQ